MSNQDVNPLQEFERLPRAFWRIIIISGVLIAVIFLWTLLFRWPFSNLGISWPFRADELRRFVFLSYMCVFGSVWIMYFLSRSQIRFFRVKTLRNLLAETSEHWKEHLKNEDRKGFADFVDAHHRKAQSTMVTVAIMIASSLIVLGEIHCVFLKYSLVNDIWSQVILAIAMIAAMLSLICFIITADALDSIFNKFRTDRIARKLKHHFYLRTINPKYCGFISLIASVIFIVAYHSLTLSCIVLALCLTVGYPHWFPDIEKPSRARRESIMVGLLLLIVVAIVEGCI